jgi:hypothetical protein
MAVLIQTFLGGAQSQEPDQKLKSVIITEEKHDALIKKEYKESETYYDIQGNVIEEIKYKEGRIDEHFKYQYDSSNHKIREEEYDDSGRLKEYSEYRYEKGLRVEKLVFDSNKKLKTRKIYRYTLYSDK